MATNSIIFEMTNFQYCPSVSLPLAEVWSSWLPAWRLAFGLWFPLTKWPTGRCGDLAPCLLQTCGLCGIITISHFEGTSSDMNFVDAGAPAPSPTLLRPVLFSVSLLPLFPHPVTWEQFVTCKTQIMLLEVCFTLFHCRANLSDTSRCTSSSANHSWKTGQITKKERKNSANLVLSYYSLFSLDTK